MSLNCALVCINPTSGAYQAGQTPPPALLLTVYNPNASAVYVSGIEMVFKDQNGLNIRPAASPPFPPIGVGQTTSVPATSSITIGPFPVAFGSAAAASSYDMVAPGSQPWNPQGSQRPQSEIWVGANVYGSDGSINQASPARILLSYTVPPPLGYQGGFASFNAPNNCCLLGVIA